MRQTFPDGGKAGNLGLIGGTNFYCFNLKFSGQVRVVHVALDERTGLYKEKFSGTAPP